MKNRSEFFGKIRVILSYSWLLLDKKKKNKGQPNMETESFGKFVEKESRKSSFVHIKF